MRKVLIFSLAYFPKHIGGAEVSVREITDRILDIEFHVLTNRFDSTLPQEEKIGNTYVHRIGMATDNPTMADLKKLPLNLNKPLYQFLAVWHALLLHRKYRFDAMWAVMAHATGVPSAIFKMLHPEVKYILNLQEGDPIPYIEKKMRPVGFFFNRAFKIADIVQPLSKYLGVWAREKGFTGPIEIVPNAVNAKYFSQVYPPAALNEIKDALGKKMGDAFLITTSRLVHKNAVDDVIRALPLLPENISFVVLGTGPDELILKKLAQKFHVSKRVQFLGQIGHSEMPKYLQASDIFIRPSRSEAFGASFVEAFASGLPVIATQEGGIADFLFDEKRNPGMPITGFAVDADSPRQIADVVKEIMSNPEKVRAVVRTAKAVVEEKYDWDVVARLMREKVFDKIFSD